MQKLNNETAKMLSRLTKKYTKAGAKVFHPGAVLLPVRRLNNDSLRALGLLKLSGNAVFIVQSPSQGKALVTQTLFRLAQDKSGARAIQIDIGALITADKKAAGFTLKNIIADIQAYAYSCACAGKIVLFITALPKAFKYPSIISALGEAVEEKSIPVLSVISLKEFRCLEAVPEFSGLLSFVLAEKNGKFRGRRDKSVLIIGASSLLGNALYRSFISEYKNVKGTAFSKASLLGFDKLDVTSESEVKTYFAQHPGFDIVLYIAGEANADIAEKERGKARALNVDAVSLIARYAANCKFVYISSEYVFDGNHGPYGSASKPNPINYYGFTKLEGEKVSLSNFSESLVIRLGALYGYNGPCDKETTVSKLIASLSEPQPLKADNVQIKHPLLIEDAAKALLKLLDCGASGIYQINGPEGLNKQQMAERIAAILNKLTGHAFGYPIAGIEQRAIAAKPLDTHMVNVDTPRPFDEGIEFLLTEKLGINKKYEN